MRALTASALDSALTLTAREFSGFPLTEGCRQAKIACPTNGGQWLRVTAS